MNDRTIITMAIETTACQTCHAKVNEPCVPFRTSSPGDYAKWFVHAARRWALDEAWQIGFHEGVEHGRELERYAAERARRDRARAVELPVVG